MIESLHEECGVFGIYGSESASQNTFLGLYALQHRGQESAGIVSTDGERMFEHKGMGLVAQVFDEDTIGRLDGRAAIGHNRYSTTGQPRVANIQPLLVDCRAGKLALAHNGNLVNARELRQQMEADGSIFNTTMDSEVILHLIAKSKEPSLDAMIVDAVRQLRGAFSVLLLTKNALIAVRDHEAAAVTVGINLPLVKVAAFALSALYAAIAGSCSVLVLTLANAGKVETFQLSIQFLVAVVIGGTATLFGPAIGGFLVVYIQKWSTDAFPDKKLIAPSIFGIVLILFMYVLPDGLVGGSKRFTRFIRRRSSGRVRHSPAVPAPLKGTTT
jgi:hypothetical protein